MEEKIKLKIKNYPVYIGDKLHEQTDKNICKNQIGTIVNFIPSFYAGVCRQKFFGKLKAT